MDTTEFYFVISSYGPEKICCELSEAMNHPHALFIDSFNSNGDKVRSFMYDVETKTYTESF